MVRLAQNKEVRYSSVGRAPDSDLIQGAQIQVPIWCVNHWYYRFLPITPVCQWSSNTQPYTGTRKMIKYSSISNLAKTETELYNFCNIFLIIIKYMYMHNIKFMRSIFVLWLLSRPMFLIVVLEDLQVIVGRSWQKEARNRPINCQDFFFVTTHVVQRCFRTTKRLCWQWLLVDAINELQVVDRPAPIFLT